MSGDLSANGNTIAAGTATASEKDDDDVVTPWEVKTSSTGGIDYDKLIVKFGCQTLTDDLVTRVQNLTNVKVHLLLRRKLYFSHRDFKNILDRAEQKKPFFLYTGRGPSSGSLHLGHLIPFFLSKYLQDAFNVPLIIQMTDDEKYLWKDMSLEEANKMAVENIKDILSIGFSPDNTFIFTNTEYMNPAFYKNVLKISKNVTTNQSRAIFGFTGEDSVGKCAFPPMEAAPCFSSTFPHIFNGKKDIPCLIPCAIDQDPYFRMTRDVAPRLKYPKPALIYSKFLPSLQGPQAKMAASSQNTCIFLADTANQIKNKINKYAFSGGQETTELHRQLGGNCEVDSSFQFLRFFYDDDGALADIERKYSGGEMLTGELKKIAIDVIQRLVAKLQERRARITDDTVREFMRVRQLNTAF